MKSFDQFKLDINNQEGNYMLPSGKIINFFNMNPEDINIEDIAHALSRKCRWNGWTKGFYSIAEHSIHVAAFVSSPLKLTALLHDASEAYLFDIPRPVKKKFSRLVILESDLELIIAEKFKLPYPMPNEIIKADDYVLEHEYNYCYLAESLKTMNHMEAQEKFMAKFREYSKVHVPVDWVQEEVDKLKNRLDEEKWMSKMADEIDKEITGDQKNGK